ncbi:MAG: hypothetical protein R2795_15255 [Saprospiraceae bacterium]
MEAKRRHKEEGTQTIKIVATTGMLADMARQVGRLGRSHSPHGVLA